MADSVTSPARMSSSPKNLNGRLCSTPQSEHRDLISESGVGNGSASFLKFRKSYEERDDDGFAPAAAVNRKAPLLASPGAGIWGHDSKRRTWNATKDPIIFATENGDGEPSQQEKLDRRRIGEKESGPEVQRLHCAPSSSALSDDAGLQNKVEATSSHRGLPWVLSIFSVIQEMMWELLAIISELKRSVIRRIDWWLAKAPPNSVDGTAGVFQHDESRLQAGTFHQLFRPTPKLQGTQLLATNIQTPTQAQADLTDGFSFPTKPRGMPGEGNCSIKVGSEPIYINVVAGNQGLALPSVQPCRSTHIPLSYKIQVNSKKSSTSASPGSDAAYWQYHLYRGPKGENVKVHYCRDLESTERAAGLFTNHHVLGFDLEWKALATAKDGIKKNVSLIQLACEEHIALFHLGVFLQDEKTESLVTPTLKKIMESSEITKVGVAIKADCTRLRKYLGIDCRGLLELSHLHKLVKFFSKDGDKLDKRLVSLADQVEEHLQMPLWKGDVRSSDWTKELSREQVDYAASDAYAALHVYDVLERKRTALDPTPPRPAHAELNLPIRLAETFVIPTAEEDLVGTSDEPSETKETLSQADPTDSSPTHALPTTISKLVSEHPHVLLAGDWVSQYRSGIQPPQRVRASTPQLRAYALWHLHQQSVSAIAKLLRNPPLANSTVAGYILEAIRLQRLAHDRGRLVRVLACLPAYLRGKYEPFFRSSRELLQP